MPGCYRSFILCLGDNLFPEIEKVTDFSLLNPIPIACISGGDCNESRYLVTNDFHLFWSHYEIIQKASR